MNHADRIVLGTRRYSSWSLRAWLAVKRAGLEVSETVIPLAGGFTPQVKAVSPSGMVPLLEHQGQQIWESLAIIEYCAEFEPSLWPQDRGARAFARAISAEMHAGFRELRMGMPMNLGIEQSRRVHSPACLDDVDRVVSIWDQARQRYGGQGPFLFGAQLTGADAMFAPIVARFLSYHPPLTPQAKAYCQAVRAHELVAQWYEDAAREPVEWRVAKFEE